MMTLRLNLFLLLSAYFSALLAAPVFAHTDEAPLPYVGQHGQLPVAVAVQFLKNHLRGEEDGHVNYQTLTIQQRSTQREISDRVSMTVIQNGLMDDSVQGIRWRLQLRLNPQKRWQIDTMKTDFMCGRMNSKKEWTEKLCP